MTDKKFWIGVVSRAHVQIGLSGGFVQLNHGKQAPLQKLHAGDGFVYYSPKTSFPAGDPCQKFTAIGIVESGTVYQADMGDDFHPFRIDVRFLDAQETDIQPLIAGLSFIKDKLHWGAGFRFGHLQIPASDFKIIAEAMGCGFEHNFL